MTQILRAVKIMELTIKGFRLNSNIAKFRKHKHFKPDSNF